MSEKDKPPKDSVVSVWEIIPYIEADRYLKKRELAEYLSVSIGTLEKQLHLIPQFKIGSRVIFKKSEVDQWMESRRASPGFLGPPLTDDGQVDLDLILYKALFNTQGPEAAAEWWLRNKSRQEARERRKQRQQQLGNSKRAQ